MFKMTKLSTESGPCMSMMITPLELVGGVSSRIGSFSLGNGGKGKGNLIWIRSSDMILV